MLQKEANRTTRRVNATKDKALEVIHIKDQRIQSAQVKSYRQEQQIIERQHILENNLRREQNIKQSVTFKHQMVESHRREMAHKLKDEAKEMGERMAKSLLEEAEKKKRMCDKVRLREAAVKERKQRDQEEKFRKKHELCIAKLAQEEMEARKAEALVKELAKQERAHIKRLKEAQRQQAEVLCQLEHLFTSTLADNSV